ncbi:MAG: hypothetical protein ACO3IN_04555 [Steroidobacteraceae bacterium]
MRVPSKYQIFEQPVVLTSKDAERLSYHLGNWTRLNEVMLLGINLPDLRRLVVLELMGLKRRSILSRVLGRIAKEQRRDRWAKIERALG